MTDLQTLHACTHHMVLPATASCCCCFPVFHVHEEWGAKLGGGTDWAHPHHRLGSLSNTESPCHAWTGPRRRVWVSPLVEKGLPQGPGLGQGPTTLRISSDPCPGVAAHRTLVHGLAITTTPKKFQTVRSRPLDVRQIEFSDRAGSLDLCGLPRDRRCRWAAAETRPAYPLATKHTSRAPHCPSRPIACAGSILRMLQPPARHHQLHAQSYCVSSFGGWPAASGVAGLAARDPGPGREGPGLADFAAACRCAGCC